METEADIALASVASTCDIAPVLEQVPGHIASMTAAIARGWTSQNMNGRRFVGSDQDGRAEVEVAGCKYTVILQSSIGDFGIETRSDDEGRVYRISGVERTLIELVLDEDRFGEGKIIEAFQGAFNTEVTSPNIELIRTYAAQVGGTCSVQVEYFLNDYL